MAVQKLAYTRRLFREVLPAVDAELAYWRGQALNIPEEALRTQALASIGHKRFHCEGGAVYALFTRGAAARDLVRLIVALQTISDYLDNLCDRGVSLAPRDFRALHQAMLDAVRLGPAVGGYYRHHPFQDDGGYLATLVATCRRQAMRLPGYDVVAPRVWQLASLYVDLQVLKHAPRAWREGLLASWHEHHRHLAPGLRWNEFAAAAGSTLGMFALFALAAHGRPDPAQVERVLDAYFPWVCGLHILLDYWIDQMEDHLGGDLNFTAYYGSAPVAGARLRAIFREALRRVRRLDTATLHEVIVQGLPALYLSDGKARRAGLLPHARCLLHDGGMASRLAYWLCRFRRLGDGGDGRVQDPPEVPRV